jgi:HSP20 family protein
MEEQKTHQNPPHGDIKTGSESKELVNTEHSEKGSLQLPVDVWETKDAFFVVAKISGANLDDVTIEVLLDTINLAYKAQSPKIEGQALAQENQWGNMTRSIVMPDEINVLESEARVENGVITITAPKLIKSTRKVLRLV